MGEVGISPEQDPNQRFHRTPQADGVLDSDEIDVGSINVVADDVVEVYFFFFIFYFVFCILYFVFFFVFFCIFIYLFIYFFK